MDTWPLPFAISESAARHLAAARPDADSIPEVTRQSGLTVEVSWRRLGGIDPETVLCQNDLGELLIVPEPALRESLEGGVLHWDGSRYLLITHDQQPPRTRRPATAGNITAAKVKTLRARTGLGMMTCKRALETTRGDLEAALRLLRAGDG